MVLFGRRHPVLTTLGLAGAGLIGGVEVAMGALIGAGVATIIRRSDGAMNGASNGAAKSEAQQAREPEQAQQPPEQAQAREQPQAQAQQPEPAAAPAPTATTPTTPTPEHAKRHFFRDRAIAVVRAARGRHKHAESAKQAH